MINDVIESGSDFELRSNRSRWIETLKHESNPPESLRRNSHHVTPVCILYYFVAMVFCTALFQITSDLAGEYESGPAANQWTSREKIYWKKKFKKRKKHSVKAGWTVQREPPASQWEPTATLTLSLLQLFHRLTHPNSLLHPFTPNWDTLFYPVAFFTLSKPSLVFFSFSHFIITHPYTHAVFIHSLFRHSPPSSFSCFFTFSELSPSFSRWSLLSVRVSVTRTAKATSATSAAALCQSLIYWFISGTYRPSEKKKKKSDLRLETICH